MSLSETIRSSISRAGTVRVRNALNPLLWICAVAPLLSWGAAYLFRDDLILRYGLVLLGALPILGALTAYFTFMVKDPDRLQSEEFVLRQQELSVIERKGEGAPYLPNEAVDPEALASSPHSPGGGPTGDGP